MSTTATGPSAAPAETVPVKAVLFPGRSDGNTDVDGLSFGFIADRARRVHGLQLTLGYAQVDEQLRGIQLSVGANASGGDMHGGEIAVGANVATGNVHGAQIAAGANVATRRRARRADRGWRQRGRR